MKKVSLLILVVILASTALMAATPTKMVRLTIINKSGYEVYMKLTGTITEAFYYLTVPAGDTDFPEVKVFTIMIDVYDRETWTCNGVKSSGSGDYLVVDGNLRLTFLPCGKFPWRHAYDLIVNGQTIHVFKYNVGEPRMEKVTAWRWVQYATFYDPHWGASSWFRWANAYLYDGYLAFGCFLYYYRVRTLRLPSGCYWRYQY